MRSPNNIKKYQADYLNKIMLYASGYAAVFMFCMSAATVLGLPVMHPALFVIGYLAGIFALELTSSLPRYNSHAQGAGLYKEASAGSQNLAIAIMLGLTSWVGLYIGSIMAVSPVMLGYFCLSIYSSILITSALVYFRDTLIPKSLTELLSQSVVILTTSAITWFLASVVMQASMPAMVIGFAALSSYLSVMFILTNIRMALLEAKVSSEPPHAATIAFCVFNNTLCLALDIFTIMMALKESSEDKKRGAVSRKASPWQSLWRVLSVLIDLFRVFSANKRLDELEELIVIEHKTGSRGDGTKSSYMPVPAKEVSHEDAARRNGPVYNPDGTEIDSGYGNTHARYG